jgi:hypothetical protein
MKTIAPRVIILMLFFIVVIPFLPLLISGHWDWWQGTGSPEKGAQPILCQP